MTVLIVTHSEDHHGVENVQEALEARGVEACRLDTDEFPTEIRLQGGFSNEGEDHRVVWPDGRELALGDVTAVWNRRFAIAKDLPQDLERQVHAASVEESRRTLRGLLGALDVFQLNPIPTVHQSNNKQLQLRLAREVGLEIPDTLVTNDPDAVRRFVAGHDAGVICKMMASFAVYDDEGRENVVFTNVLSDDDLEHLDELALSPMTFQEKIEKDVELRVTVVGRKVFSASIDSQASERATHDWRRDGAAMIDQWREHALPRETEERLLALCDRLGLQYGAADFIVTPQGRIVFLEINPAGEWFWLETWPGFPLSEELAAVLADPGARRPPSSGVTW